MLLSLLLLLLLGPLGVHVDHRDLRQASDGVYVFLSHEAEEGHVPFELSLPERVDCLVELCFGELDDLALDLLLEAQAGPFLELLLGELDLLLHLQQTWQDAKLGKPSFYALLRTQVVPSWGSGLAPSKAGLWLLAGARPGLLRRPGVCSVRESF